MTTTYAPDVAPDPQTPIVQWQPRYKTQDRREFELRLAFTVGAALFGALAIGAVAVGALAIGRLGVGRARIGRLDIDDLGIGRIRRLRRPF